MITITTLYVLLIVATPMVATPTPKLSSTNKVVCSLAVPPTPTLLGGYEYQLDFHLSQWLPMWFLLQDLSSLE